MASGPDSTTRVVASPKLRTALFALGWVFVALGAIGVVLPVVPTAPFLLVAVWAFEKSSPKFERYILHHPRLGPPVRNFREHRVVPLGGKILTFISLPCAFSFSLWIDKFPSWLLGVEAIVMLGVIVYVASCPIVVPPSSRANHRASRSR